MTDTPTQPVSAEESTVAFSGPALAANRFFIHIGPWVRLTFAEQTTDVPPAFRAAVVMPMQDAIALKNVLTALLADVERQIEAVVGTQDAKPAQ